ncbi:diacylglycerol/lipid kinase family protein [Microbacterium gorillae]|uniref:diacylglycerol/lipid kinase family protein n=1 Tax=Microbacterium gorillae TaxID=1231063 RepID=UPI003D9A02B4
MSLDQLSASAVEQERMHGWAPTRWFRTSPDDGGTAAAGLAIDSIPRVIIVAGGDGTVRSVIEELEGSPIPVSLVPVGTGNILARDLGLPLGDIATCMAAAFSGEERSIDMGVAELESGDGPRRHVFVVMAGIGLDAEMARSTSAAAKHRLGWFAYVTPIARSIIANRRFQADYRVDRGPIRSTRAHTIIVGNCGTLAGRFLLIPDAVIDDGLLDVVMMRPVSRFSWLWIAAQLTMQKLVHRSALGRRAVRGLRRTRALAYTQGREFDIRFEAPHDVQLDGDHFGRVTTARISIGPASLRLRVPRASSYARSVDTASESAAGAGR